MSERLNSLTKTVIAGFVIYEVSKLAFSKPIREKIKVRDGMRCVNCGSTEHLECAHIDHNPANPRYDHESNGRLLCTEDHLKDHINRHGRNGLPKHQNEWAIKRLLERVVYKAKT